MANGILEETIGRAEQMIQGVIEQLSYPIHKWAETGEVGTIGKGSHQDYVTFVID